MSAEDKARLRALLDQMRDDVTIVASTARLIADDEDVSLLVPLVRMAAARLLEMAYEVERAVIPK